MNNVRLENDRPKTGGLENDRTAGETAVAPMTTYCPVRLYGPSFYDFAFSAVPNSPFLKLCKLLVYIFCHVATH